MARLHHPNIAGVEDIGTLEDDRGLVGAPYYAMPYVDGESVRALLKRRIRLSPGEALDLVIQAAAGLAAIHDAGVIHCDVKPDNLVIARANGAVVLIDFGVMHLEVEGERSGFYGTFAYASDHQVAGKTPRREDDLFSLSMVLYELVTGVRAFADFGSGSEGARARAGKRPTPARKHGIEHPILETLIETGLHPDEAKRWSDAGTMKRALERVRTLFVERGAPEAKQAPTKNAPLGRKITPTDLADPTVPRPRAIGDEIVTRVSLAAIPPRAIEATKASAGMRKFDTAVTIVNAPAPVPIVGAAPPVSRDVLPPTVLRPLAAAFARKQAPLRAPRSQRRDVWLAVSSMVLLAASIVVAAWILKTGGL